VRTKALVSILVRAIVEEHVLPSDCTVCLVCTPNSLSARRWAFLDYAARVSQRIVVGEFSFLESGLCSWSVRIDRQSWVSLEGIPFESGLAALGFVGDLRGLVRATVIRPPFSTVCTDAPSPWICRASPLGSELIKSRECERSEHCRQFARNFSSTVANLLREKACWSEGETTGRNNGNILL
jgi:hypothetical protein